MQKPTFDVLCVRYGQVFDYVSETGERFAWGIDDATAYANDGRDIFCFSPSACGIDADYLLERVTSGCIDADYAMTTDENKPVIFVPMDGTDLLIDGWHRLYKCVALGIEDVPCVFLSQEEADACRVLTSDMIEVAK